MAQGEAQAVYTASFPEWRCAAAFRLGWVGSPLRMVVGGWNQESHYLRYKFGAGDRFVLVSVHKGLVYVCGAMTVVEKVTATDWLRRHPEDRDQVDGGQVVVGRDGLDVRFDRALPLSFVSRIGFVSNKVERPLKGVEGGLVKQSRFNGVFRLSASSAAELHASCRARGPTGRLPVPAGLGSQTHPAVSARCASFRAARRARRTRRPSSGSGTCALAHSCP